MTDYGLKLKNYSHGIQIDSTYKNLSVLSSGSLTLPASGSWSYNGADIDITNVSKEAVIFFRPITDGYLNHQGFVYASTQIDKVRFIRDGKDYPVSDVCGKTLYYRFYYLGMLNAKPTYGMAVYNPSINQVFNSNNAFLRALIHTATLNYSINAQSDNYVDVTVSDADSNYFLLSPLNWCLANNGGADYSSHCYMGMKKINSTTIRVAQIYRWREEVTNLYDYSKWSSAITLIEAIA